MNFPVAVESIQMLGSESASASAEEGERETKVPAAATPVQENFPVAAVHWTAFAPVQFASPEPKVEDAEAWPMTSKSPEKEAFPVKSLLPATVRAESRKAAPS